ncbi:MAG: RNA polymerase sigma factor RpoE [Acidobacteriaceae bacterium]
MRWTAGVTTVGNFAGAISARGREDEIAVVAELKAGSEAAYEWLISHYHQPLYSLIYRMVNDPADAADTTQEVFLKVFRGIHRFHGDSSLKTWLYRIALHEAANQKRWWCRHKQRETSMEASLLQDEDSHFNTLSLKDTLVDQLPSPFEGTLQEEVRAKVEEQLNQVSEPYRTVVILRDIEDLSYEEIAEVLEISIGTVKSRLVRGREALRKRLEPFVRESGQDLREKTPRTSNRKRLSQEAS